MITFRVQGKKDTPGGKGGNDPGKYPVLLCFVEMKKHGCFQNSVKGFPF